MPIISIYTVVYNTIYIHRSSPTAKTPEQKQKVSGCESASVLLQVASLQLSDATSSASSLAASYSSSSPPSSSLLCKASRTSGLGYQPACCIALSRNTLKNCFDSPLEAFVSSICKCNVSSNASASLPNRPFSCKYAHQLGQLHTEQKPQR